MARSETDEIIGRMADTAVHLVNVNVDLLKRLAAQGRPGTAGAGSADSGTGGPAQDAWATWAESAGDVVQLSYLTAQLLDAVWGDRGAASTQGDEGDG
jgi:hypothetical protein